MAFINVLIIILTLSSTPISILSGPVTYNTNSTTNSSTNVAVSARKGADPPSKQPGGDNMICETCRALSEKLTCCFNASCVDLSSNRFNCGSCGIVCDLRTRCCGGLCVDITKDNGNCGNCGNACAPGQDCSFGLCGYA
uniref:Stig1 n=2 Tax=Petunia hybrida TaxID=4102 RepID=Q9SBR1_PETHY|nr:Stig1 [Petunia x hybrida]